jgi:hypothetical protein
MMEYYTYADLFSPGIHPTLKSGLSLPSGDFGALGVDFVGLGAKNLAAVMNALIPDTTEFGYGPLQRVRLIIHRTRAEVDKISAELDTKKELFSKIVGMASFSGDDGVHYPLSSFTPTDLTRIQQEWAKAGSPSDGRFSYMTPTYLDGQPINDLEQDRLRSVAESLEKQLRLKATNRRTLKKLKKLAIGIYYWPAGTQGGGLFDLILAGPAAKDLEFVAELNELFKKLVQEKNTQGQWYQAGINTISW